MITISRSSYKHLVEDAIHSYPFECCGFLMGNTETETIVTEVLPCINRAQTKENRFLIAAEDYLKAEKTADANHLQLLGIYHSHPNSEAIPSATDKASALPNFSYLILAVRNSEITDVKSWQLNENFVFEEEEIRNKHTFFI